MYYIQPTIVWFIEFFFFSLPYALWFFMPKFGHKWKWFTDFRAPAMPAKYEKKLFRWLTMGIFFFGNKILIFASLILIIDKNKILCQVKSQAEIYGSLKVKIESFDKWNNWFCTFREEKKEKSWNFFFFATSKSIMSMTNCWSSKLRKHKETTLIAFCLCPSTTNERRWTKEKKPETIRTRFRCLCFSRKSSHCRARELLHCAFSPLSLHFHHFWFLHFHRGKIIDWKELFTNVSWTFSFCCNSTRWGRVRTFAK